MMIINNQIKIKDKKDLYIKLNPDIEGFEFPSFYFKYIEKIFFSKYYNESICFREDIKAIGIIYCNDKFNQDIIDSFPEISFKINQYGFEMKFSGKNLFHKKNDMYYFKILEKLYGDEFDLGRIFFKKYIFIFRPEMKQIYFYNNSEEYIDNNKSEKKIYNYNSSLIIFCNNIIPYWIFHWERNF